ncbi:MAG: hypothetical protein ACJA0I_001062, partial [Gammaproteobacteria bacterium]
FLLLMSDGHQVLLLVPIVSKPIVNIKLSCPRAILYR